MSQEVLAERAQYSADFIGLVERGVNAPSVEGCERIAKALKIPVCALFDFDATLPEPPKKPVVPKSIKCPRGRPRLNPAEK